MMHSKLNLPLRRFRNWQSVAPGRILIYDFRNTLASTATFVKHSTYSIIYIFFGFFHSSDTALSNESRHQDYIDECKEIFSEDRTFRYFVDDEARVDLLKPLFYCKHHIQGIARIPAVEVTTAKMDSVTGRCNRRVPEKSIVEKDMLQDPPDALCTYLEQFHREIDLTAYFIDQMHEADVVVDTIDDISDRAGTDLEPEHDLDDILLTFDKSIEDELAACGGLPRDTYPIGSKPSCYASLFHAVEWLRRLKLEKTTGTSVKVSAGDKANAKWKNDIGKAETQATLDYSQRRQRAITELYQKILSLVLTRPDRIHFEKALEILDDSAEVVKKRLTELGAQFGPTLKFTKAEFGDIANKNNEADGFKIVCDIGPTSPKKNPNLNDICADPKLAAKHSLKPPVAGKCESAVKMEKFATKFPACAEITRLGQLTLKVTYTCTRRDGRQKGPETEVFEPTTLLKIECPGS